MPGIVAAQSIKAIIQSAPLEQVVESGSPVFASGSYVFLPSQVAPPINPLPRACLMWADLKKNFFKKAILPLRLPGSILPVTVNCSPHLRFLPVILTCVVGTKPKRRSSGFCKLLYFLIGVKWHGRGRRFDPD